MSETNSAMERQAIVSNAFPQKEEKANRILVAVEVGETVAGLQLFCSLSSLKVLNT